MRRLCRLHACAGLHGSQMGGSAAHAAQFTEQKKYILALTKGILSDCWLDCRADVFLTPDATGQMHRGGVTDSRFEMAHPLVHTWCFLVVFTCAAITFPKEKNLRRL